MRHEDPNDYTLIFPKNGKRVSVIGAGASGLTCGYYLSRIGYEVDVYESQPVAGGVLAFGIPQYRLPGEILEKEIELIKRSGVNIILNTEVGKDISFKELRNCYEAVYIASGTQFPQKVKIPGENLNGVLPGINFLKDVKLYDSINFTGKTVAVIGGGNTAIDSARTALRLGAKKVTILYRRTRDMMPAYQIEVDEALHEGVELVELIAPVRFVSDKRGSVSKIECVKCRLSNFDNKGKRNTVRIEDSNFFIDVDAVITAVSQYSDLPFIHKKDIGVTPWGTFITDPDTLMTTMAGVFAGGDVARGPDEVIRAIADGKHAARSIDLYLGGTGKLNKGEKIDIPHIGEDDEMVTHDRFPVEMLPLEKRTGSFDEVVLGYHRLNAMAEAMRCLHCDRR
jgi:NADH-quinone oxidoreductase subunit F